MSSAVKEGEERISFLTDVSMAAKRVLLLDYDGAIAPSSADRHCALPYPGVPEMLRGIMTSCGTRLIILTGHAVREVRVLLGMNPAPEIWGCHGMEKLSADGSYDEIPVTVEASMALAEAESRLKNVGLADRIEVTRAAVAVHWMGLLPSKVCKIRTKAYRVLEPLASPPDLVLADLEEGVELRLSAANKGDALLTLLSDLDTFEFPVAYLGGDITDEDAFLALNGRGLTVLVRPKHCSTAAHMWLRPHELLQFLADWIRVCQVSRSGPGSD